MSDAKKVALYARVSTTDQTTENQLLDLRKYCSARGWAIVEEFKDDGISGTKTDRKDLQRLMEFVRRGKVDCVLVWKFDRFARNSAHMVNVLEEFRGRGVDFASLTEGIDTTTIIGKCMFTISAAFAELERSNTIERIHAGLRRARLCRFCKHPPHIKTKCGCECERYESTKRLGNLPVDSQTVDRVLALQGQGSIRTIAARIGISKSVVGRIFKNHCPSVLGQNVAYAIDDRTVA
jgi:DNA invertase Pin-like site-specific DNA recombinase